MQLTKIEKNGITCAIVNGSEPVIIDAQTALDVLMSAKYDLETSIPTAIMMILLCE